MAFPITIENVQYSAAGSLVRLEEDDVVFGLTRESVVSS